MLVRIIVVIYDDFEFYDNKIQNFKQILLNMEGVTR